MGCRARARERDRGQTGLHGQRGIHPTRQPRRRTSATGGLADGPATPAHDRRTRRRHRREHHESAPTAGRRPGVFLFPSTTGPKSWSSTSPGRPGSSCSSRCSSRHRCSPNDSSRCRRGAGSSNVGVAGRKRSRAARLPVTPVDERHRSHSVGAIFEGAPARFADRPPVRSGARCVRAPHHRVVTADPVPSHRVDPACRTNQRVVPSSF